MVEDTERKGMGWLPDYPDLRDYTTEHEEVQPKLRKVNVLKGTKAKLPTTFDLRKWCSPIEDQGQLGSCTANAGSVWPSISRGKPSANISTRPGCSFTRSRGI